MTMIMKSSFLMNGIHLSSSVLDKSWKYCSELNFGQPKKQTNRIEAAAVRGAGELTKSRTNYKSSRLVNQDEGVTAAPLLASAPRTDKCHVFILSQLMSLLATKITQLNRRNRRVSKSKEKKAKLGRYLASLGQVRTSKDFPSAICHVAESLITLMEPAQRPASSDPTVQLADNFAPVTEECPPSGFALEIEGVIPPALNGIYIRNGPNPQFAPTGGYHQFDGDGMLHGVRIHDGQASYCCRYVRTFRFVEEGKAGMALMPKPLGELYGLAGLARLGLFMMRKALGVISNQTDGIGCANAGLAFHNGRLLAMSEDDKPYVVHISPEDGDLTTLGRLDFEGNLSHPMTAHPKVDPITGEMFSYGYNLLVQPYLTYFRVSPTGQMSSTASIKMKEPTILHDFVVTEKYVVFPEPQIVFRIGEMKDGYKSPIVTDEAKVPRIGVMPKYDSDSSRIQWFDVPGASTSFHYFNGWDEGDEVTLIGSCMSPLSLIFTEPGRVVHTLTKFSLNLKTGQSSKTKLTTTSCDIGGINPLYAGRKNRFVYLSTSGPWPKLSGVVKLDIAMSGLGNHQDCLVASRNYPPGCYGSEPFFVSRSESLDLAEDDGYLLTYIHNERTNVSELLVMDAQSPLLETVASIRLPTRVPYGFHGIFLSEHQLSQQNKTPCQQ